MYLQGGERGDGKGERGKGEGGRGKGWSGESLQWQRQRQSYPGEIYTRTSPWPTRIRHVCAALETRTSVIALCRFSRSHHRPGQLFITETETDAETVAERDRDRGRDRDRDNRRNGKRTHSCAFWFAPFASVFRGRTLYPEEGLSSLSPHGGSPVTRGTSALREAWHTFPASSSSALHMANSLGTPHK
jgi:hypothetical protein